MNRKPFITKVDTAEFRSLFTPGLKTLLETFAERNHEVRIAGGAVRDILSGKVPNDVDLATDATLEQMKEMFTEEQVEATRVRGKESGTIKVLINNETFEVTTLLGLDENHTTDWELDASRRDLTINSLFLGVDGTMYDYFGGYEDLQAKRVVFTVDANRRIQERTKRILRYFRIYARIAEEPNKHDQETIAAIKRNISGLEAVSGESVWKELSNILNGNFIAATVTKIIEVGAAKYIGLPEEMDLSEFRDLCKRVGGLNPLPVTLLVGMLRSEEEMVTLHARLKLSAAERGLAQFIIKYRNEDLTWETVQGMMLESGENYQDTCTNIRELLKYTANLDLLRDFESWQSQTFHKNYQEPLLKSDFPDDTIYTSTSSKIGRWTLPRKCVF